SGLGSSGFGFFDLVIPDVKKRQTRPCQLVIWAKLHRAFPGFDCLRMISIFHEGHRKCMPSIEELRSFFDALSVLGDRIRQFADREISIRITEKFFYFWSDIFQFFLSVLQI